MHGLPTLTVLSVRDCCPPPCRRRGITCRSRKRAIWPPHQSRVARNLRRSYHPQAALVVAVASVLLLTSTSSAEARGSPKRHRYRLADGVTLTTIRYPEAPNEVRVLTLEQGHGPVTDVLPGGPAYPDRMAVSKLGARAGALAGVNGDFAVQGRLKHLSILDGEIWTSGIQPRGPVFASSGDGAFAHIGEPHLETKAIPAAGSAFVVDRWNAGPPRKGGVHAFTLRGGSVEEPPGTTQPTSDSPRWCAARLLPTGAISWTEGRRHLSRPYIVDAQPEPCPKVPIARGTEPGTVVLAARARSSGNTVLPLSAGQRLILRWKSGWPSISDTIGGTPMLVHNGRNVAPGYKAGDSYFFNYNPRTAVGISHGCEDDQRSTTCRVYVVTVDGRQAGWSHGMRFPALAQVFIHLGAVEALNLDGGGSTEVWLRDRRPAYCERVTDVGGCLASRPSDVSERPTSSSLVILPSVDSADPRA